MATRQAQKEMRGRSVANRDPRFRQLLELAREGNEDAVGDLWREFGFDHRKEGGRHGNA